MPELHRVLSMPEYAWICLNMIEYVGICKNIPKSASLPFLFRFPIVIPCLLERVVTYFNGYSL